jgi:hypothetical protein
MAHVKQRGEKWFAQVRRKGFKSRSASFKTKEDAEKWANAVELAIEAQVDFAPVIIRPPVADPYMTKSEIYSLPRVRREQCVGVYFLFLDGVCVYAGQSLNLHARVDQHLFRVPFDSYSWINVPSEKALEVERHYIRLLQPEYNVRDKKPFTEKLRRATPKPA